MNRLERFYKLHDLLRHAHHPVPMRQLEEELGVLRNAVGKDIQYLRTFFGAPIQYHNEKNGYYYDPDAGVFELPGLWMNASELHALLVCQQLLQSVQPGLMENRLKPLRKRIRTMLKSAGKGDQDITERVRVQPLHYRSVDATHFQPMADALLSRKPLSFTYQNRGKNQQSQRRVSPQQLRHYRDNWYLLAYCHQAQALRLFSLDRIQQPVVETGQARDMEKQQLDDFANPGFGIFTGQVQAVAHLRFNHHAARWVADEHWHPDQHGEWHNDGYHLHIPYSEPTELIMEILRHGPDVAVLGPTELRETVADKITAMAQIYCTEG